MEESEIMRALSVVVGRTGSRAHAEVLTGARPATRGEPYPPLRGRWWWLLVWLCLPSSSP